MGALGYNTRAPVSRWKRANRPPSTGLRITEAKVRYLTAPLFSEDRQGAYYQALEAADGGDTQALTELLAKNLLRVADRYLAAIREVADKRIWLDSITKTAAEKVRETDHRRFMRWGRVVTSLRIEFHELAEQLSSNVPGLLVRATNFQGIDLDKYKILRQGGRAERTWIFGVDFRYETAALRFVFWGAHHYGGQTDPEPNLEDQPSLLISMEEQQGLVPREHKSYYRTLDELTERRFSLREIVIHQGRLLRRRHNPVLDCPEWDLDVSPGQVARDFYTEVLQSFQLA